MSTPNSIDTFWQSYLATLPAGAALPAQPEAWHFCDNQADADELVQLVLAGVKRATASLLRYYEVEDEQPPKPGDLSIVTDWAGEPLCLIEATQVDIQPFNQVDAAFAAYEGEGDGSLAYWQRAHRSAFGRECQQMGWTFEEDMLVVCERFKVIFR